MGQLFAVEKATQMASISGASEQSDPAGGCVYWGQKMVQHEISFISKYIKCEGLAAYLGI